MTTPRDIHQTFTRQPGLELRSTWRSRQAYKRHSHAQLSIGAVVEGNTRSLCDGQEYLLAPGDIIVIPPHVPHSCNPLPEQTRSYHMLYLDTALPLAQQHIRSESLFGLYLAVVEQMSTASVDALLAALALRVGADNTLRPTSQQVQQALLSNPASPPSLDALARQFSLRKETLIRTFKQDTGLTPGSFLNVSRVEYAKARLRAGDDIADVAYQSGFADQSHFHKTFVSYTAATPRQYALGRSISDNN